MANFFRPLLLILAVSFLPIGPILAVDVGGGNSVMNNLVMARPGCQGSMAECLLGDEIDELEFQFDSEASRRILATSSKYISYNALNKDKVPCSKRGASYYNCKPGAQANPYKRGCSKIARCSR